MWPLLTFELSAKFYSAKKLYMETPLMQVNGPKPCAGACVQRGTLSLRKDAVRASRRSPWPVQQRFRE